MAYTIAIVGATGLVGKELLKLLEKRHFPVKDLILFASPRSKHITISFKKNIYHIQQLHPDITFNTIDIIFFCSTKKISLTYIPIAKKYKCFIIDNSSAFRLSPDIPLVIPEINGHLIKTSPIIANPNCSTILMNMVTWPIYEKVGIERIIVSTYQAISGAGKYALQELEMQAFSFTHNEPYHTYHLGKQCIWNAFSHNSPIDSNTGYNEEELKMIHETHKIFNDNTLHISATCVRIPVFRAHCESINITLKHKLPEKELRSLLQMTRGIKIIDDRHHNIFPEPILASEQNDILVGRIRKDISQPDQLGYELFISGDQLLKGAALNAIQIAEIFIY